MKKKIVAMCATVALAALAVGGTLAYFTDTDSDKNVMTTGKVDIVQLENGESEGGFQTVPLMPMVDTREAGDPLYNDNGMFNEKMKNVVTKVVTVKNEAAENAVNQSAYVRTIFAFETITEYKADGSGTILRNGKEIFDEYFGYIGDFELLNKTIEIDGVEYALAMKVYDEALAPGETSEPSLEQIFLAPTANNEVAAWFGDEYQILVLSQGVQTEGFNDAATALNTAFPMTDENLLSWFGAIA